MSGATSIRRPHRPAPTLERLATRYSLPQTALVLGAVVAGVVLLGILYEAGVPLGRRFDINREASLSSAASGGLLLLAATAAFAYWQQHRDLWFGLLAAFLLFMACDEVFAIHERAQATSGVEWQRLYLPVVAAGALAGLLTLRALWNRRHGHVAFLLGGAGWAGAMVLERFRGDINGASESVRSVAIVTEESLEMAGTVLIVIALLAAIKAVPSRPR